MVAGLRDVRRGRGEPCAVILLYHRVATPDADPFRLCVSPERFEAQLEGVRARYRVVALPELIAEVDAPLAGAGPCVAVSFDDGYVDNLELAVPIASALDVPVTVFVTVRPVLDGTRFWWDELADLVLAPTRQAELEVTIGGRSRTFRTATEAERLRACSALHGVLRPLAETRRAEAMAQLRRQRPDAGSDDRARPLDADGLRKLARLPAVTVGSHTMTHPSLTAVSADARRAELVDSRRELGRLLEREIELVSYPYGRGSDLGAAVVRDAATAGYTIGCTTVQRAVTSRTARLELPRVTVPDVPADELLRDLSRLLPPR